MVHLDETASFARFSNLRPLAPRCKDDDLGRNRAQGRKYTPPPASPGKTDPRNGYRLLD